MFWVFEAVPMLVAIGVFCVFHPSAYPGHDGGKAAIGKGNKGGEGGDSEELSMGMSRYQDRS